MKNLSILGLLLLFLTSCHGQTRQQPPHRMERTGFLENGKSSRVAPKKSEIKPVAQKNNRRFFQRIKKQEKKELIVIDAGHGGDDGGTRSLIPPKYEEKSLNLATAFFLKEFLQKMGYLVEMTREDDTFISLPARSHFANGIHSKLFISVHYNAAASKAADGIEVYYYKSEENKERSEKSKKLANLVLDQVLAKTEAKSRGVKHGNLSVIRETKMPAILVEGGFMTNEKEMKKIKDPAYIKKLAFGIALGVDHYLKSDKL